MNRTILYVLASLALVIIIFGVGVTGFALGRSTGGARGYASSPSGQWGRGPQPAAGRGIGPKAQSGQGYLTNGGRFGCLREDDIAPSEGNSAPDAFEGGAACPFRGERGMRPWEIE